jgi:hypothetical protein
MLGDMSQEYKEYINQTAATNNWKIIDIMNDPNYSGINPSDFIGLIRDSQMVITDSFHGAVFSLLYHKKIALLGRIGAHDMSSRLSTLLRTFNMEGIQNKGVMQLDVDWAEFEKQLLKEYNLALNFLLNNL